MNLKLKINYKAIASALLLTTITLGATAQESAPVDTAAVVVEEIPAPVVENVNPLDTIYPIVETLQSEAAVKNRLKISGYVQAQYQTADTAGVTSIAGGNFGSGIDNRMMIRRGRIKVAYDNELSQAVLQFDITEKGLGIKDAYLSVTEPLFKTASLTAGVFDRPFGYEISYSSSTRETPERSRVFQTLFPGERDLGGRFSLQAPKTSRWNFIRFDLGYMGGNGPNVETDSYKDLLGHLSISKTTSNEKIKWGLGASFYNGGFAANDTNLYSLQTVNGEKGYAVSKVAVGDKLRREYYGFDGQFSIDWWLGMTQIRSEYLWGTQPATSGSSSSLTAALPTTSSSSTAYTTTYDAVSNKYTTTGKTTTSSVGTAVYSRNFQGYYVYLIQNIFESPLQLVAKYDVYDPNTDISGDQIMQKLTSANKLKQTGEADIKYTTWGFGLNYRWNSHVKVMAYYDIVTNETSSNYSNVVKAGDADAYRTTKRLDKDRKDNVFTLRLQYKF